jgi:hypothetical protein
VVSLGAEGLQNLSPGYDAADAATVVQLAEYFLNITGVFFGTVPSGSTPTNFNFENAFMPYTAGN